MEIKSFKNRSFSVGAIFSMARWGAVRYEEHYKYLQAGG